MQLKYNPDPKECLTHVQDNSVVESFKGVLPETQIDFSLIL